MTRRLRAFLLAGALIAAPTILAAQNSISSQAKAAAVTAQSSDGLIPIEHFAKLPFMEAPRLSPDGRKIAAKLAVGDQQMLAIVPLRREDGKLTTISTNKNDLNWWRWVNDDWLIAGVGSVYPVEGQDFYLRRLAGISADGKKINIIAKQQAGQGADDVLWVARDGTPQILLAYQRSIYLNDPGFWPQVDKVDVSTGRMRKVVEPREGVFDWYADANGNVRMGLGYNDNSRASRLLYRADGAGPFKTVDRANIRKGESLTVPSLFLADSGKALTMDSEGGFAALRELDLATMQPGKTVFSVPGYDLDGFTPDLSGTALAGVHYTDERSRTKWLDARMAQVQADIDKALNGRVGTIISLSRDWSKMLVHVGAADRGGAFYVYHPDQGAMLFLAQEYDGLGTKALSPVTTIKYKARDGLEIAAVLTLPKGRKPSNLPLILMPHGGPFARDSEAFDWWVQFLANRGYAVLQPNYRGSSGYGTAFEEKGAGQWGLAMQDDLNDAVDWAVKEGIADKGRVCIVGASYGGYAAFRAAQRDGARFRCAISYAGVSDLAAMRNFDSRFLNSGRRADWLRKQAPDFKAVSPLFFAQQVSIPLLVVHGKEDLRVPVRQSREMVEKLKAAGKPVRYIEQPLGDHHFSRGADRLQFLKEVEAFLHTHNPS